VRTWAAQPKSLPSLPTVVLRATMIEKVGFITPFVKTCLGGKFELYDSFLLSLYVLRRKTYEKTQNIETA
jgi:hypothetical protein